MSLIWAIRSGMVDMLIRIAPPRFAAQYRPVARPVTHSLVQALRVVPAFAALDEHTLVRIVGASANLFWSAGSSIFEKGTPGDALYIVLSGNVGIYDVDGGDEVEVGRIGPGDFFGE